MTVNNASALVPSVRVVLVDDHALVRHGLRALLESVDRVRVVGEAGGAVEALRVVRAQRPDVVLLDVRLGLEDGVELAQQIREAVPDAKILVVSAHGGMAQLRAALLAGADGYLLKGITAPQLVDGVRRVSQGEKVIDPSFVPTMVDEVVERRDSPLSARETEVVTLVAEGLTTQAVASRLRISHRTVHKHLENAYRKLGVSSRAELVTQAFRRGVLR